MIPQPAPLLVATYRFAGPGDDGWEDWSMNNQARWFVFDDRQMYRPGEEVHIKGWVREYRAAGDGSLGLFPSENREVLYTVNDAQYNSIANGVIEINALGGFDFAIELPTNVNLGYANVEMRLTNATGNNWVSHHFQIQEFRRPEFEVTARQDSMGPYTVGDAATVAVSADYFSGGSLANADVTWNVNSNASSYTPPNWSEFVFGTWTPWWFGGYYESEPVFPFENGGHNHQTFTGKTDASGEHFLQIDIDALESETPQPYTIRAEASVMDVNRQQWSSSTNLLVHPSDLYVGLRSERYFVKKGTPLDIEAIVTDIDGNAVTGRSVTVTAARLEWKFTGGRWQEVEADVQTCDVISGAEAIDCRFTTDNGGSYLISATVVDDSGRENQSSMTRWVSGGNRPQSRNIEQEQVTLIPNQDSFQPGEMAEILVQSPFGAAEGLLSITRNGLVRSERFTMSEGTHILQIPIEEAHVPGMQIQVDLVGSAERTDNVGNPLNNLPSRPAYATGSMILNIPPLSRTLNVAVTPAADKLDPGSSTTLDVLVQDAQGQPVADADLAVIVVDEAILALTGYQMRDPIAAFYTNDFVSLEGSYSRSRIVLISPEQLSEQASLADTTEQAATMSSAVEVVKEVAVEVQYEVAAEESMEMDFAEAAAAPMEARVGDEAGGGGGNASAAITVRSDFNPLAVFQPQVTTDANGQATVDVPLPDNLTRYRIMVVAAARDNEFGSAESSLTARLPIQVRPSAPRFLNFGDEVELPIVIQNQTDEDLEVDVAIEASNILLTNGGGRRVIVPANDRIEVRFPATPVAVGTGRLQIAAVATNSAGVEFADAATVELPIYTPATTEAFATYGVVDGDNAAVQPLAAIEGVFPQFGGLEIGTSSTALQSLTDAVFYLVTYRFESAEALSSRILAVSALRDVLGAFSVETLPSPDEIETIINSDIDRLRGMQNRDGGFPYWQFGRESIPFNTIHAVHALHRAGVEGFDVPENTLSQGLSYLRDIESHYPEWYGQATRHQLSAHALYVRHLTGDSDVVKAVSLYKDAGIDGLTLEGLAWLWQVMATDDGNSATIAEISRHISNRVVETPNAANFTTDYTEETHVLLQSDRRTDAVILQTLINQEPDSDLIVKVVNGLQ
ncbi:MAG: alpha-2-macroglobulin family protein, partial [Candidatus Promineifilaceae bacterium]